MKKVALIIIALQLAAGAVLTLEAANRHGKNMPLLFCLCLLSTHASLLGMWGALSKWDSAWRRSMLVIGGIILTTEFHLAAKLTVAASSLVALMPIGFLFAFHRAALKRATFLLLDPATLKRSARPQFTILQMLAFTTIVAVVAALARFVSFPHRPLLGTPLADEYLLDMATFSLCSIPVSIVCSWSLFSIRWSWPHWLAILITPALAGLFPMFYRSGPEPWIFVVASFVQAVLLGSALLPLRLVGYRFIEGRSATWISPPASDETVMSNISLGERTETSTATETSR